MQNRRGRTPYGLNQQQIGVFGAGLAILIVAYVLYQLFFSNGYYSLRPSLTANSSSLLNPSSSYQNNYQGNGWNSYSPYSATQSSSGYYDSSNYNSGNYNSYTYSNPSSLNSSTRNDTLTGYWILFDSNGTITQFNLSTNDYAFIQRLIQNDNKGIPKIKIFLVENGQTRQYIVSNELYTIIANMNFIIDSRAVNNTLNSSTYGSPSSTPNTYPNSSSSNPYPNSSSSSSNPNPSSSSTNSTNSYPSNSYSQNYRP